MIGFQSAKFNEKRDLYCIGQHTWLGKTVGQAESASNGVVHVKLDLSSEIGHVIKVACAKDNFFLLSANKRLYTGSYVEQPEVYYYII